MKSQNNPFFSANGRITVEPFRTDQNESGADFFKINYYRLAGMYTYSVQAQMQKRIFAKFPHPQDELYSTIQECKFAAKNALKNWTDQNRLKKCFTRLVPVVTDQLDLFDDL